MPDYNEPANYDGDEDYYYLPDVDAYYSVPEQCYYYNDGGSNGYQLLTCQVLTAITTGVSARRYEVRAPSPFMHDDYYRARYNGVAFNGSLESWL